MLTVVLLVLTTLFAATAPESVTQQPLRVAVTFDDLPMTRIHSLPDLQTMTAGLLDALERQNIVTVGFVNEIKLDEVPAEAAARCALLAAWLDRGHELGNHTYSHLRLYDTAVAAWGDDVLRGERVTRGLMAERGRVLRYFRHPTLNTGRDLAAKTEASEMFAYCERLSVAVVGRPIPQVLLVHANWLNADCLPGLAGMLGRRGYRFIPLEDALEDPAYALPDRYVGRRGPSWLERWAVT